MVLINKIKIKWGIKSNLQLLIIFLVFGVTGSTSVWVSKPILDFVGLKQSAVSTLVYWPVRIVIIFPVYQTLLLIIGSIFGQSKFFKNFIKKMFQK